MAAGIPVSGLTVSGLNGLTVSVRNAVAPIRSIRSNNPLTVDLDVALHTLPHPSALVAM
jgi:hypothetical protein